MFTEDRIKEIVLPIAKEVQGKDIFSLCDIHYKEKFDWNGYVSSIPNPSPFYADAIHQRNRVRIHADDEAFPYDVLKSKAPNQKDDEWKLEKEIFENPTTAVWSQAVDETKIIGNNQNFSILWPDPEQEKYFKEDYPEHHSLESYFFNSVRPEKVNYPNTVLLVRPYEIPWKNKEEFIVDQSVRINYVAEIISEYRKLDYKAGEYLVVLCEETVIIEGREVYQFDFYDKDSIWKIIPVKYEDGNYIYRFQFILKHDKINWLPARQLKGVVAKQKGGYELHKSIYSNAIPSLRKAIRTDSTLTINENNNAFATRIRMADRCTFKTENNIPCNQGKIWDNGKMTTCPACQGKGVDASVGAGGEIIVKAWLEGTVNTANPITTDQVMSYKAPPTDIYAHLDKRVIAHLDNAFKQVFNANQANSQTATGVESKRHGLWAGLLQFSDEFFDLLSFAIETIGTGVFKGEFKPVPIRKPTEFDFRTVDDITDEIAKAKTDKVPDPYLARLYNELSKQRFNTDPNATREDEFIKRIDRVYLKDDLTVTSLVATGRLSKVQAIIHDSIGTFITQAESDYTNFWDLDYKKQSDIIYGYANDELKKMIILPAPGAESLLGGGATP